MSSSAETPRQSGSEFARSHQRSGNLNEAERMWLEILDTAPAESTEASEAMWALADLYEQQNELVKAEQQWQRLLEFAEGAQAVEVMRRLATLYERGGTLTAAEEMWERIHEVASSGSPEEVDALRAQIRIAKKRGDDERAEELLELIDPEELESLEALGESALSTGEAPYHSASASLGSAAFESEIERPFNAPETEQSTTGPRFVLARVTHELDTAKSDDRLGIDLDARALAALVAHPSTRLPLAIGIYGGWGSGKTFFMRRMDTWVESFKGRAGADSKAGFHPGVVPIWFNAWHYAGGNILASLLSHIFNKLHPSRSRKQQDQDEAFLQVEGTRVIRDEMSRQVDDAKDKADAIQERLGEAKKAHRLALEKAVELKKQDVLAALKADEGLRKTVTSVNEMFGLGEAGESLRDLSDSVRDLTEYGTQAKALATAGKGWRKIFSPLGVGLAAFVTGVAIVWVWGRVGGWADWTTPSAALVAQVAGLCSGAAAWLVRQSRVLQSILKPAQAVQRSIDERVALQREKDAKELAELEERASAAAAKVATLTQQHADAQAEFEAASRAHEGLSDEVLLRRYLSDRAGSTDYDQYKGLVALAYRDLEDLSGYLTNAANKSAPVLRRIVLYIDDLDRCAPDTVAEVLAAVHLLLALPLFAVVVGVDPHWLKSSLEHAHHELFTRGHRETTPTDYLEKIFQLTYTLRPMSPDACERLLAANTDDALTAQERPEPRSYPSSRVSDEDHTPTVPASSASGLNPRTSTPGGSAKTGVTEDVTKDDANEMVIDALTLTASDKAAIADVAPLLTITPRRAKRFLNTYLVLRARAFAEQGTDLSTETRSHGLLLLTALRFGTPLAMRRLTIAPPPSGTIADWIEQLHPDDVELLDEVPRLRWFRDSATDLSRTKISDVLAWSSTADPYTRQSI